jgi:deoxyribonuclease V
MKQAYAHPWPTNEAQALQLQQQLAPLVVREDRFGALRTVAGVDVAYDKHSNKLVAAVVVLDIATLTVLAQASAQDIERFPYIPGLFSFRELPPIALALEQLDTAPDLIVCDGQGIAHPRRFGLACHLGILFDIPTIGCGKTRLLGQEDRLERKRGNSAALRDAGEEIGSVVCTQDGIKPLYVSVGHRVSLATAGDMIVRLAPHYRLPETTRHADQLVKKIMAATADACRTLP